MPTILVLIAILAAGHGVSSEACSQKLDLVVALDVSSSICGGAEACPDWTYLLQFVKNIVASFNIGPDDTRVALLTISSEGKLEWNFDEHHDQNSLSSAIDKVVPTGGELVSIFSFSNIVTSLVATTTSQRSNAAMVLIGITDGTPRLDTLTTVTACTALQAIGMNIMALCVTDRCDVNLVRATSSPPRQINETYFAVKDFKTIHHFNEKVVKQICSFKAPGVLGSIIGGVSTLLGF